MVDWTKLAWCRACSIYKPVHTLITFQDNPQKRCPDCNRPVRQNPRNTGRPDLRKKRIIKRM